MTASGAEAPAAVAGSSFPSDDMIEREKIHGKFGFDRKSKRMKLK